MKIRIFFLVFFIFCTSISRVGATNNLSSNKYTLAAQSSISKYVASLQAKKYSQVRITRLLKTQKSLSLKKMKSPLYTGEYKLKLDALILSIDANIASLSQKKPLSVVTPKKEINLPPSTNSGSSIQKISTEFQKLHLVVNFHLTHTGSETKEYDVYTFIPSNNLIKNKQPQDPSIFIAGEKQVEKNTFNAYTITTKFQAETEDRRVVSIRNLVQSSEYTKSGSVSIGNQTPQAYALLTDGEFFSRALVNPKNYQGIYATYMIYIAKDNSEAFFLHFSQVGTKTNIGELKIDSITQKSGTPYPQILFRNESILHDTYDIYLFSPKSESDIEDTYRNLGMGSIVSSNFIESFAGGSRGQKLYSIEGYSIPFDQSKYLQTFFTVSGASINIRSEGVVFETQDRKTLSLNRQSDGASHRFLLLVSKDKSQAILVELTQYIGDDE